MSGAAGAMSSVKHHSSGSAAASHQTSVTDKTARFIHSYIRAVIQQSQTVTGVQSCCHGDETPSLLIASEPTDGFRMGPSNSVSCVTVNLL